MHCKTMTYIHIHARTLIVLVVLLSLFSGCGTSYSEPSSANTPEEMFEALIAQPVPKTVTALQGVGDTWQGYSIFLRFTVKEAFITEHIIPDYNLAPCNVVLAQLQLPQGYDRFTPSWTPDTTIKRTCYESKNISNPWTYHGEHFMLLDNQTKTIYFHGRGG